MREYTVFESIGCFKCPCDSDRDHHGFFQVRHRLHRRASATESLAQVKLFMKDEGAPRQQVEVELRKSVQVERHSFRGSKEGEGTVLPLEPC